MALACAKLDVSKFPVRLPKSKINHFFIQLLVRLLGNIYLLKLTATAGDDAPRAVFPWGLDTSYMILSTDNFATKVDCRPAPSPRSNGWDVQ